MGADDIRVKRSWKGHLKRLKLQARLGPAGPLAFIDLLISASESRPDGILKGWGKEDISIMSQYLEDSTKYVDTLLEVGLLDQDSGGVYSIHDWKEHNPFASNWEARSGKGRLGMLRRYWPDAAARLESEGKTTLTEREYLKIKGDLEAGREFPEKEADRSPIGNLIGCGHHPTTPYHTIYKNKKDSVPKKMTRKKQGHDPKNDPANDPGFLEFWSRYPRKVKKPEAVKAWAKLNGDKPELSVMLSALDRQKASPEWNREGGRFIPHPSTWLSHKRWEDETTIQDDVRSVPEDRKWERPEGWADPNWLLEMDQQLRASEGQELRGANQGEEGECNGSHESIKI